MKEHTAPQTQRENGVENVERKTQKQQHPEGPHEKKTYGSKNPTKCTNKIKLDLNSKNQA